MSRRDKAMAVEVLIPPPLRPDAGGQAGAEFPANTVAETLSPPNDRVRESATAFVYGRGKLRSGSEDARYIAQENTLGASP
jgi:hypothetical protein